MSRDIVIGAGIAGLSAAVYLSAGGRRVELIEASQKPGGRAYSLTEKSTGTIIDNGQHIMMGCYYDTLKFFRMIGAYENLIIQEKLSVDFLLPQLQSVPLKAFSKIYPLNLSAGLLAYRALSIKDRLLLLRFFLVLPLVSDNDLKRKTVYDWLVQENQNERIRKAFWEILVAGALNTSTYKASAKIFKDILVEIFLKGNKAATIVIPKKGLTESYCDPAINYIGSRGGIVTMGEQVNKLIIEDSKVKAVVTNKRIITNIKNVITAIPYYALSRILPDKYTITDPGFEYSSILTVHVWLKEIRFDKLFYGLVGSEVHWIFNRGTHITLVRSDAGEFMDKSKEEIFSIIKKELYKYCFIEDEDIVGCYILKEKRATFIPSESIIYSRPGTETKLQNLYLAGDWIDTGLPSTIESAVKSGRMAAELLTDK